MSAADVAAVREEVIKRIAQDHYGPEASLEAIVADTILDVLDPKAITNVELLIKHLVTKGLEGRRCDVCRGKLIGKELAYGTCGHCGGRSINPTISKEVTL